MSDLQHVLAAPARWRQQLFSAGIWWALPLLVFVAGLALTYLIWQAALADARKSAQEEFDFRANVIAIRIENRLRSYQQILEDAAGLIEQSPQLSKEDFRDYVARLHLDRNFPGTQGIGYLPLVSRQELPAFLNKMRGRGLLGYELPDNRDYYGPVVYLEPFVGLNQRVIGFDLFAEPVRHQSLLKAWQEGMTTISGRLVLVQDLDKGKVPGVLISTPVYWRGRPVDSPAQRQANLRGWVAAPLRISDLLQGVLGEEQEKLAREINLRISDTSHEQPDALLYRSPLPDAAPGNGMGKALFTREILVPIGGRVWDIDFASLPALEARHDFSRLNSVLLTGSLVSLMLALIVWLVVNGRARAEKLAAHMTHELQESRNLLEAVIEGTTDIIYVKDPEGLYLLVNQATAAFLGLPREEVLGRDDRSFFPPEIAERVIRRDQQIMANGCIVNGEESVTFRDERHTFLTTIGPIRDEKGQLGGMFGIFRDITERQRMEQQVVLFRNLAEAIGDPVFIISPAQNFRQIYVNEAACKHFGESRSTLLQTRIPDWDVNFSDDLLEPLWERVKREKVVLVESEQIAAGGRRLPVEVLINYLSHQGEEFMAGTFRDISERKRNEEALKLAASVFEASNEGVLISDADNRILAVNAAFTRLTGYSAAEALGQTTSLLKSDQNDESFYRGMWTTLLRSGSWQGEIWNRRKNGEVYPEWLSINTLFDAAGQVHRRFAIFTDITDKKKAEDVIWHQANYDALTELPNRRLFRDRLQHEIKRCRRSGLPLALLFMDLDRFKEVNDALGHDVGDLLLVETAKRIAGCVRDADTVARLGGDEFIIILAELHDTNRVSGVAHALVETMAQPFEIDGHVIYISASIGITLFPEDGDDDSTLLKNADHALYATKGAGRNGYSFFTENLLSSAQLRMQLGSDMRHALAGEQFVIHYQPIISLADDTVVKAEALLRWQHPQLGLISPAQFIPISEETGLINDIGDWVFKESALFAKEWLEARRAVGDNASASIQVSVNKSPRQFLSGESEWQWPEYLDNLDLPPECIVLEITEGLLLDDRPGVADKLNAFARKGLQLALDDFGTGYSAMSYLKKFDIDFLKIDQSFVRDMENSADDQAIVEAIIVMAHKLNIKVIAEGIETEGQRRLLLAAGCDFGQGYLFGRPMEAELFRQRYLHQAELA